MSEQGQNIQAYGQYLTTRIKAFASVKTDYVRTKSDSAGQGRLRKLSVDKGLLRETESVQKVISPLLKCKLLENEVDNEITLTAFRLLVADLLILFQAANEGVINVLEHYFEMSKPDAERALAIYNRFVEQTDGVIVYMSLARSLEAVTRLEIPNLQHAPTSLGNSLEEYVRDPDFEQNRIQYLAQKANGRSQKETQSLGRGADQPAIAIQNGTLKSALKKGNDSNPFGAPQSSNQVMAPGNADLLDFFGSIETQQPQTAQQYSQGQGQNVYTQQPSQVLPQMTANTNPYMTQQHNQLQGQMTGTPYQSSAQQYSQYSPQAPQQHQQQQQNQTHLQQAQMTGYGQQQQPQPSQISAQATGAGFGGYTPQAANNPHSQFQTGSLQPQVTGSNPFRKSMMPMSMPNNNGSTNGPGLPMSPQRTGGNPFSRGPPPSTGTPLFSTSGAAQAPYQQPYGQAPSGQVTHQQTGGNPFGKSRVVSDPLSGQFQTQQAPMQVNMTGSLMPQQQTGTANPFRKSMMPMGGPPVQQSYGGAF